jgi:pyruvate formate lyase activating enzyme
MDPTEHKRWTGVDNALILDNIRQMGSSAFPVLLTLRIPLISGINDSDGNLNDLAKFSRKLTSKLQAIELLPYHRLGVTAYRLLEQPYLLESAPVQTREDFEERVIFLRSCNPGVQVLP